MNDLGLFCLYLRYFPSYQVRSLSIEKLRLWGFWKYVIFFEKHWPGLSISQNKKSNPWKNAIFDKKKVFDENFFYFRSKNLDQKSFDISKRWRFFSGCTLISGLWGPISRAPTLRILPTKARYIPTDHNWSCAPSGKL